MTNRLVVFIHGLGGDPTDTWAKFPELLAADAKVTSRYSAIESFGYETSKTGATRPLAEVAFELANFLDAALLKSSFDEIAFITHSQGGLLARRYLCNLLLDVSRHGKPMPLFRLLTFATPHWGAYSEKGGWAVPESRAQQKGLAYDSESILTVNNEAVQ
jgi:triacylglycerol esterase/lipase EstA (alpha/beta hydrolase family)